MTRLRSNATSPFVVKQICAIYIYIYICLYVQYTGHTKEARAEIAKKFFPLWAQYHETPTPIFIYSMCTDLYNKVPSRDWGGLLIVLLNSYE
jgi:hypothetical protein